MPQQRLLCTYFLDPNVDLGTQFLDTTPSMDMDSNSQTQNDFMSQDVSEQRVHYHIECFGEANIFSSQYSTNVLSQYSCRSDSVLICSGCKYKLKPVDKYLQCRNCNAIICIPCGPSYSTELTHQEDGTSRIGIQKNPQSNHKTTIDLTDDSGTCFLI